MKKFLFLIFFLISNFSFAETQQYENLKNEVQFLSYQNINYSETEINSFNSTFEKENWLNKLNKKLIEKIPNEQTRNELLKSVHYEATRAGLEPELILGLIHVESGFNKYAISSVGARGFMQVMPFWVEKIGEKGHNLFHIRTNLRYGCTILRYYLTLENGNIFRALARYNGSLGQNQYPINVINKSNLYK